MMLNMVWISIKMQKMQTSAKTHVTNHNIFGMLLSKVTDGGNLR